MTTTALLFTRPDYDAEVIDLIAYVRALPSDIDCPTTVRYLHPETGAEIIERDSDTLSEALRDLRYDASDHRGLDVIIETDGGHVWYGTCDTWSVAGLCLPVATIRADLAAAS